MSSLAIFVAFTAFLALVAFKYVPSVLDPVLWASPNRLPKLEGVLSPNNLLSAGLRTVSVRSDEKVVRNG